MLAADNESKENTLTHTDKDHIVIKHCPWWLHTGEYHLHSMLITQLENCKNVQHTTTYLVPTASKITQKPELKCRAPLLPYPCLLLSDLVKRTLHWKVNATSVSTWQTWTFTVFQPDISNVVLFLSKLSSWRYCIKFWKERKKKKRTAQIYGVIKH